MAHCDDKLLLANDSAREIFREIEDLPVLDVHTHVNLSQVLENENGVDPWTALCGGDHYVSSIIESLGAINRETMFDPATDPYDKWLAYAKVFPHLIGNQIRDWMSLTLSSLGVDRPFNPENAKATWDEISETLRSEAFRPIDLFKNSNIVLMCTTDNPVDSLTEHREAAGIFGEGYWLPAWRPDVFFDLRERRVRAKTWTEWVRDLEHVSGASLLGDFKSFLSALAQRHDYFAERGCRVSDYGVRVPYGHEVTETHAARIFEKASARKILHEGEAGDFQSYMMRFSMGLDFERGWISQIHYGVARNLRDVADELGGLDSGCDTIDGYAGVVDSLRDLLNYFDSPSGRQHKILIYSLSKSDWEKIAGLSRVFPSVYSGSSWWYFDSVSGMLEFMRTVPDLGAGFRKIGPFVTDARNIYSLGPRTQVYRRCLSTVLGEMVEARRDPIEEAIDLARYLCSDHVRNLANLSEYRAKDSV